MNFVCGDGKWFWIVWSFGFFRCHNIRYGIRYTLWHGYHCCYLPVIYTMCVILLYAFSFGITIYSDVLGALLFIICIHVYHLSNCVISKPTILFEMISPAMNFQPKYKIFIYIYEWQISEPALVSLLSY